MLTSSFEGRRLPLHQASGLARFQNMSPGALYFALLLLFMIQLLLRGFARRLRLDEHRVAVAVTRSVVEGLSKTDCLALFHVLYVQRSQSSAVFTFALSFTSTITFAFSLSALSIIALGVRVPLHLVICVLFLSLSQKPADVQIFVQSQHVLVQRHLGLRVLADELLSRLLAIF